MVAGVPVRLRLVALNGGDRVATWDKGIAAIKAKRAEALLAGATPAEQAEIAALLAVPQTFREFVTQVSPKFEWYPAQELIAASLERVARGECKRLMVFMPPQEGKSQLVTRLFPAYYLTQHPDRWVGLGSYSFALAKLFSRAARDFYKGVASTSTEDASAVEFWETGGDGGLWAVGRGGSATGRSAHLAIIDDPLKDRAEAESEIVRGTLHDWYGGVINMRLQPESAVVIVHCMTGDTNVLMADGESKPLRDIRAGDHIATYDGSRIATSTVKNWRNQGSDCIFTIRTRGGVTVRANARHPFLIERDGQRRWTKVKDLRIGDRAIRVIGENGRACNAPSMDVTNQQPRRAIAPRTTTRRDGPPAYARHQSIADPTETPTSNTATAFVYLTTTPCCTYRTERVLYAESRDTQRTLPRNGVGFSAWITMDEPDGFEDSSVTTATLRLDEGKRQKSSNAPPNTYAITLDAIVEIVDSGSEDVFDIEVERTENFIANGLVSHNTRWHEDDLSGHLLNLERTGDRPERWHIIDLPGIAEKAEDRPEYPATCTVEKDWRQPGEPLGGRYPMQRYEQIRVVSGTREYDSQVQQRPSPSKGTIFQRQWWGRYTKAESPRFFDRTIISVDCAFKDMDDSDFVAIHVYGRVGTNVYLRDRVHARMSFTKTVAECRSMMLNYPRAVLYVEDKANGSAVIDTLRKELMGIIAVQPEGGKIARAYACQGDVEQGRCWLPDDTWMPGEDGIKGFIREATSFPSAPHDDDVDAFTQAMTVFRWELREALKAERPEPQQNEAMGWDYEKNVQRHRMTADEEMSQMLSRAGSNPLAARMSHSTIPQRTR